MAAVITIHHPKPQTNLPTHEQAARRRRAADAHLPAIPGLKPRRTPTPKPQPGRKTADLREYNAPRLY